MSRRYGRSQFLKDAASLGLSRDTAVSRAELRRRRDRLIVVHHPDHGGDAGKAAEINTVYARMIEWLDERRARAAEARDLRQARPRETGTRGSTLSEGLNAGAAKLVGLAIVAAATYATLRGKRKP